MEPLEIQKMSTAERLKALEQLWDALRCESAELSSPPWHGDVLADRKNRAKHGKANFLTLEQLRARLRASSPE